MCFLALSCIETLKNPKKILIIIQRSNGDVFLSMTLINTLYEYYHSPQIDLLVNDDTYPLAKLLSNINFISSSEIFLGPQWTHNFLCVHFLYFLIPNKPKNLKKTVYFLFVVSHNNMVFLFPVGRAILFLSTINSPQSTDTKTKDSF
mgnify:CR=1 FL=1